jgi:hypothetical protein
LAITRAPLQEGDDQDDLLTNDEGRRIRTRNELMRVFAPVVRKSVESQSVHGRLMRRQFVPPLMQRRSALGVAAVPTFTAQVGVPLLSV